MNIKCVPFNSLGVVDIATVPPITIVPTGTRAAAPYPPGKVRINTLAWPNGATLHGDVTLSWAHRLRTAQLGRAIVSQDADSAVAPIEGNYTVEVLIAGVVKRTALAITGTSYIYTLANRQADDADATKAVCFRITPVSGTTSGTARTTDSFVMAP